MKKYTIPTLLAASLAFTSCGDDKAEVAKEETAKKEAATAQKQGSHAAVKAALKSQVNSVTADLMLKVPSFLDLTPAEYNMPDSLEGRDMVQVTVKWPISAKDDLYSLDSVLHDLQSKPTIIEKKFSKGDQVDYVESTYVLEADGGGGYISRNSRYTKQNFEWPTMDIKSNLGKTVLVKGSDEHLAAAKEATVIKQAAQDKVRANKLLAEVERRSEIKAQIDQLMSVLRKEGNLSGDMVSGRGKLDSKVSIALVSEKEVAGNLRIQVAVYDFGNKSTKATFEGTFTEEGKIILNKISKPQGRAKSYYVNQSRGTMKLLWDGHIDRLKLTGSADVYDGYTATFLRD